MENSLFFVFGAGFFLYGFFGFCRTLWSMRRCRRRVNAVICDVEIDYWSEDKWITHYSYSPVYQYTVGGQEYRVASRVKHSKKDAIKVGSYAVIFVDEEKPQRLYCPADGEDLIFDHLSWSVMGIGWGLFPILGLIASILICLGLLAVLSLCSKVWLRKRQE